MPCRTPLVPSSLTRTAKARALHFLLCICAWLPLPAARALGRLGARVARILSPTSLRITERNIRLAFPEMGPREQRQLACDSLSATAQTACEMGHVWLRDIRHVRQLIRTVSGESAISTALTAGRGVVVLGPHLGNWEILGLYVASLGPLVSLYEPPHMQELDGLLRSARERSGARLVPTSPRGLAALVRSVRDGQISGILPDQVPRALNAGLNAPFMNIPCFTGTLASKVIQRSGAMAVFGFAQRVDSGFCIRFLPAEDAVYSPDMALSVAALNRGVEACLRHCPAQYQWEYKRFRQRPAVYPDHYENL